MYTSCLYLTLRIKTNSLSLYNWIYTKYQNAAIQCNDENKHAYT